MSGWNWGAFFFGWIWCIAMRFYLGILLSFTGIIGAIVLGIYGNKWAWKHRRFKNIEEFAAVQRSWKIWGFVLLIISICIIILLSLGVFNKYGLNFNTIDDATNEEKIRPISIGILTTEESEIVKKLDIKKIVPDNSENKPDDFNMQYTINTIPPHSVWIYQNAPAVEGNNPDIYVTIDQWIGTNNEFLLPNNVSESDLKKVLLQDGTQAYTYWKVSKITNEYSYYIFWIKKPIKFVIRVYKQPYEFDIAKIDKNLIEAKALRMANEVIINSAYLFQNN